jgi:hypothetical protein
VSVGSRSWQAGTTSVASRSRCRRRPRRSRAASPPGRCAASSSPGSGPLRQSDLRALGDAAPDGPILGVRVEHLVAKEALLADNPEAFFTIPHFDGYPAILVLLEKVSLDELEELIVEAWLSRAPKRVAKAYLDQRASQ